MSEHDVVQISVGGHRTGIIGLKVVLEQVAKDYAERPDQEIKAELMTRLGKSNYIVPSARAAYEAAGGYAAVSGHINDDIGMARVVRRYRAGKLPRAAVARLRGLLSPGRPRRPRAG